MRERSRRAAAGCIAVTVVCAVLAVPATGTGPAAAAATGHRFAGVTPKRLLDTRTGLGAIGPVPGGGTISVTVAGGSTTVPANASAVVLNVTGVNATLPTHVTVFPTGQTQPFVSNLNVFPIPGSAAPNLVTVKVGSGGQVSLFNNAGAIDLVADVVGYYADDASKAGYRSLQPERLLDTRDGTGGKGTPFGQGASYDLQVTGGSVPAGATAVVMNLTGTEPTLGTYVTAWPTGVDRPEASNLNLMPGETRPNLVTVKVGSGGQVSLYNNGGSTHLVADVVGYYTTTDATAWNFVAVDPYRSFDTRVLFPIGPNTIFDFHFNSLPAGSKALVTNTTVTQPTAYGYLTVYPAGASRPLASSLNFVPGQTIPNLVITGLSTDGDLSAYNSAGNTHVVFDTYGYFLAP